MPNYPITELEIKAWDFSREKHKDQVRKFINLPYFDAHVQKVNGILKQYTKDEILLIASILHDVLEDCYDNMWIGYAEIKSLFGKEVADIVLELTSSKDEIDNVFDGSKTNYLIHKMCKMSSGALTIKLCDRLQNISDAFTASASFRNKYFKETTLIINSVEENVELNTVQQQLIDNIKSKLSNINSIFKIKKFKDI